MLLYPGAEVGEVFVSGSYEEGYKVRVQLTLPVRLEYVAMECRIEGGA